MSKKVINKQKRDVFLFYRSFCEAALMIEDTTERLKLLEAIMLYGLDGAAPEDLTGSAAMCWKLISPVMKTSRIRAEAGAKGGAPKGNSNARKKPASTEHDAPTLDEVAEYCNEYAQYVDAERFFDYYSAIGWVWTNPNIHDWREMADNWNKRNFKNR